MQLEAIVEILEKQDKLFIDELKTHLFELMEKEFIMTEALKSYLEKIIQNNRIDLFTSLNEERKLTQNDVLVKKADTFSISKQSPDIPMYFHKHTYFELDYVYKGSCNYYVDNKETSFQLKENDICLINQNVAHAIEMDTKEAIVFKCFLPYDFINMNQYNNIEEVTVLKDFFKYSLMENSNYYSFIVFNDIKTKNVKEIMSKLFFEYNNRALGWTQAVKDYLSLLFIELMRTEEERCKVTTRVTSRDLTVSKIINYIHENYQNITLKDLSKELHFHENYLSRLIKLNTDMSFSELLQQVRLKEAEKLLLTTDLPVSEISYRIGYSKANYFYRLFKLNYGLTPIQFRNKD